MEESHECLDADHMIAVGLSDWYGRDREVRLGQGFDRAWHM